MYSPRGLDRLFGLLGEEYFLLTSIRFENLMNDQSETPDRPADGTVSWFDLTVEDAGSVKTFYEKVVGWQSQPVSMGEYDDFCVVASDGNVLGGVCHSRGANTGIPPVWMMYINVSNINATIEECHCCGGKVIQPPRRAGGGQMAILQDPAGAYFAVYQSDEDESE